MIDRHHPEYTEIKKAWHEQNPQAAPTEEEFAASLSKREDLEHAASILKAEKVIATWMLTSPSTPQP
jgi:hypothetical protein